MYFRPRVHYYKAKYRVGWFNLIGFLPISWRSHNIVLMKFQFTSSWYQLLPIRSVTSFIQDNFFSILVCSDFNNDIPLQKIITVAQDGLCSHQATGSTCLRSNWWLCYARRSLVLTMSHIVLRNNVLISSIYYCWEQMFRRFSVLDN